MNRNMLLAVVKGIVMILLYVYKIKLIFDLVWYKYFSIYIINLIISLNIFSIFLLTLIKLKFEKSLQNFLNVHYITQGQIQLKTFCYFSQKSCGTQNCQENSPKNCLRAKYVFDLNNIFMIEYKNEYLSNMYLPFYYFTYEEY